MKDDKECCGGGRQCSHGSEGEHEHAKCERKGYAGARTEHGDKLAAAEAKAAENWDLYLRLRAEFENYQKRNQRDLAFNIRCGKRDLVGGILPVIDDLERALAAETSASPLTQGVEMIMRKLLDVLAREGVKPIESIGCAFDPKLHEAVAGREQEGVAEHTVVEEVRRGYTYDDDVIRPSLVIVAVPKQ